MAVKGWMVRGDCKRVRGNFGVTNVLYLDCGEGYMTIHFSKLIKIRLILLYVNQLVFNES